MKTALGPLKSLYQDPEISEIMIDGPHKVRFEKDGEVLESKVRFKSSQELEKLISALHGKAKAEGSVRETRLDDGTRVVSVSGQAAVGGPFVLIRKPRHQALNWEMLLKWKFVSEDGAKLLSSIVASQSSVLVAGSAGSGLTTFVSILSSQIPAIARVIGLEERATLQLQHPNAIVLSSAKEKREWVATARSLLPDAIIVAEAESFAMAQLVRAADERVQLIAALRAGGVADALRRTELLCLQSNVAWSAAEHRAQIAQAIRFVVFQDQLRGSGRRLIREIAEVDGLANGSYKLEPLMRWNEKADRFEVTERGKKHL